MYIRIPWRPRTKDDLGGEEETSGLEKRPLQILVKVESLGQRKA